LKEISITEGLKIRLALDFLACFFVMGIGDGPAEVFWT
jgi:hypothetical protein